MVRSASGGRDVHDRSRIAHAGKRRADKRVRRVQKMIGTMNATSVSQLVHVCPSGATGPNQHAEGCGGDCSVGINGFASADGAAYDALETASQIRAGAVPLEQRLGP